MIGNLRKKWKEFSRWWFSHGKDDRYCNVIWHLDKPYQDWREERVI